MSENSYPIMNQDEIASYLRDKLAAMPEPAQQPISPLATAHFAAFMLAQDVKVKLCQDPAVGEKADLLAAAQLAIKALEDFRQLAAEHA